MASPRGRRELLFAAAACLAGAGRSGAAPARGAGPAAARVALVENGEAALARGDTDTAERSFERAAGMAHGADAELGLARVHMQRGEYGRALALAAHTAGGHAEETSGTAFHAWLLCVGGQQVVAVRLLDGVLARLPGDALARAVRDQCGAVDALVRGSMLQAPARLAPYAVPARLPPATRVVATATLIDGGSGALAPLDAVSRPHGGRLWVRDGLGRLAGARIEQRLPLLGLAVLRLAPGLRAHRQPVVPARDAFPGSIAYAARHALSADAAPAWPLLAAGFVGVPRQDRGRELGFVPAGRAGGPVYDATGRWIGVTVQAPGSTAPVLIAVSQLQAALRSPLGVLAEAAGAAPQPGSEGIYEAALRVTLQLLA